MAFVPSRPRELATSQPWDSLVESHNLLRAAVYTLLASLLFAGMGVAVRFASTELPNTMIVFMRTLFGLLALLPWLVRAGGWQALATRRLPFHLFRAGVGMAAMYCFFYALAHLQLAEAVILNYSSPLFIAVFALLLLGEKPNSRVVSAIILGFIGVGLVVKPGAGVWSPAAVIGVGAGILTALAMVGIRGLSSTEPTRRIVFYFSLFGTLIAAVPLFWTWQTPSATVLGAMVLAGTGATAAQLLLTKSYSLVPAAQVGPYTYSSVIFAAIFGWLLWGETPDLATFAGSALIVTAGIMTLRGRTQVRMGS